MADYRNTKYCKTLDGITERKQEVKQMVLNDHPRAKDIHAYVSVNDKPYKSAFMRAYNYKCAYCGVSSDLIPKASFEIDHFVNQKADSYQSKKDAGVVENLVLACHDCNHSKSGFAITDLNKDDLNPDELAITLLFNRDEMFYIQRSEKAKENSDAELFYKQLHLGSEIHRIDYLVMSMIGLQKKLKEEGHELDELSNAIIVLIRKRNLMTV